MTWQEALVAEKKKPYFKQVLDFVKEEKAAGKAIYPPSSRIFHALALTELADVRVVILGQDPYHGPGQAHGLCFSVPAGVRIPPSLQNIYKELQADLGLSIPNHGNLESWAKQGVMLLNAVLTVEAGQAASHAGHGWEEFTDAVIDIVNQEREHVVFLLWGGYARSKGRGIDRERHLVLEAPHPSPLSAYRGFFGCRHFSQTNTYLKQHGIRPIDWQIR